MADDGTALREAFMAEIEAARLTPPTADAAIRGSRKRRWRGLTFGAATVTALVSAGGGAVIAGGVLDENGNSTDIVSVDAGTRPPGAGPDIVGAGVVAGKPWKFRAWTEGPERICFEDVERQVFGFSKACDTIPGRTARDKANDRNRFGGGGGLGPVEGEKDLYAAAFQAEVSPDVAYLKVTWKGAKEPLVIHPVQIDPDTRAYVLVVTARGANPAYTLKAYDAAGREVENTHL
ncbi:hypothetical protein [Embleya hyalina]|uniref:Uncharacterized protein n=1 Tax=Embleya hyalina TaxID=516124 RepID=A0A401YV31_9ACTN|nr:hypothetical protein [Embleya hyalina]GCD98426.1 hypothetical protein EHYA_06133 [Embleya hyalina]